MFTITIARNYLILNLTVRALEKRGYSCGHWSYFEIFMCVFLSPLLKKTLYLGWTWGYPMLLEKGVHFFSLQPLSYVYFCNSPSVLIYTLTINVLLLVMPNTYLNLCLNSVILLLIPSWISVCLEYLLSLKMFVLLAWQTCVNPDSPSPAITQLLPSDSLLLVWDITSFQPLREPTSCPLNLSQHLA